MTRARLVLSVVTIWAAAAGAASAQVWVGSDAPHRGSFELSGGVIWSGGYDLGSRPATETRNPGTGAGSFDVFTTSTQLTAATGGQARAAVYLMRSLSVEGGVQYLRPQLSTRVANDVENAPDLTAGETITRYVVDGSLVLYLNKWSFAGGRGAPVVLGGGGYIRDVHAGTELIETVSEIHAGAGIRLWFGTGAHHVGLRAEAGVTQRNGGFDFSDDKRMLPTAGASVVYLF